MSLSFISFGLSFRRLRCFFESCDLYWTLGRPFSIGGLVSILSSLDCSDQFLEDNFNAKELQAPCWRRCYPQSHPRVFFRLERVKSWTNSIWSQRIMGYIYIYTYDDAVGRKDLRCPVSTWTSYWLVDWSQRDSLQFLEVGIFDLLEFGISQSLPVASMVDQQTLRVPHQAAIVYKCSYL